MPDATDIHKPAPLGLDANFPDGGCGYGDVRVFVLKELPDYPLHSSGDDGPVRVRRGSGADVGQPLGQGVQLVRLKRQAKLVR